MLPPRALPPPPPSPARVVFLLARLAARRWLNRSSRQLAGAWRRKKPGRREATPRKRGRSVVLLLFFAGLFALQSFAISSQFLGRLGSHLESQPGPQPAPRGLADPRQDPVRREPAIVPFQLDVWRSGEGRRKLAGAAGLLLLALALVLLALSLGTANQDLGKVEWSFEWLFTFPAPAWVLFLARVAEFTAVTPFGWIAICPFVFVVFVSAGLGVWSVVAAPFATLVVLATVASLRLVLETWLRTTLPVSRLKNVQAGFTLLGTMTFLPIFWIVLSHEVPEVFLNALDLLPAAALWNPISLPVKLLGGPPVVAAAAALMALVSVGLPWLAVRASQRLVRDGLISSSGVYSGVRRADAATSARKGSTLFSGIAGKDLRLLTRDRNFLVQTLVVPIFMIAIQFVVNPRLLEGAKANPRHAAALAFGVGAYVLVFSAFQVLSNEGRSLWLLFTFPQDLRRLLLRKTILWCGVAATYTAVILIASAASGSLLGGEGTAVAVMALIGVLVYAFIASGLGVLATDPLQTEVHRKVDQMTLMVYMLLAGLYGYAIYSPTPWQKLVQVALSICLAAALWQKVADRIPYLLDPTEAPPPRLALSDGLIVTLAFFVMQGLAAIFLTTTTALAPGATLFFAFVLAGFIVCCFSLYVFARLKIPRLGVELGLWVPGGRPGRSVLLGLTAGSLAGAFGLVYALALRWFEPLRVWILELGPLPDLGQSAGAEPWILALAVFAAPIFEEYIFRGLVFRGLSRSTRPALAIVGSAALFAIVHPPVSFIPVFVLGIVTAFCFQRSRLLLGSVVAHSVYNLIVLLGRIGITD